MAVKFSRFDIPTSAQVVINKAIELKVIDALGVAELVVESMDKQTGKGNAQQIVNDILDIAWNSRHSQLGGENHSKLCKAAEDFWRLMMNTKDE